MCTFARQVVLGVLAVVSLSQPAAAVLFTNSNQLNLTGRDVLSAVSFYDSTLVTVGSNQQVTSSIQGTVFTNFDHQTQTAVGPLTVSFPHAGDGRSQTATSITGTGADQAPTIQLATALTYISGGPIATLSYAFGAENANRNVQVQLIGGDSGWTGQLNVLIGANLQGTIAGDNNSSTADLLTFDTMLNGAGNLNLTLDVVSGDFYGIAGAIVTAEKILPIPEPSSLALLGLGCVVLARRRRRFAAAIARQNSAPVTAT